MVNDTTVRAGQCHCGAVRFGVNAACLHGVSPFDFPEVAVVDGVDHPSDTGRPARRVGTLRFIPAD